MAAKTAGQKRAAARQRNKEMREAIEDMNNQQLKNFFSGFEPKTVLRIEKALVKAREELAKQKMSDIDEQIAELQKTKEALAKGQLGS